MKLLKIYNTCCTLSIHCSGRQTTFLFFICFLSFVLFGFPAMSITRAFSAKMYFSKYNCLFNASDDTAFLYVIHFLKKHRKSEAHAEEPIEEINLLDGTILNPPTFSAIISSKNSVKHYSSIKWPVEWLLVQILNNAKKYQLFSDARIKKYNHADKNYANIKLSEISYFS